MEAKTILCETPEVTQETGSMKNNKEYSVKLDKFFRSVKSGQKVKPAEFADPIDALIYGLISESVTERQAKKVFKNLQSHVVDYNDLRVSRTEEVQELLEDFTPRGEQAAANLTKMLSAIFDKYDGMSLKNIDAQGKRQAKKDLEELSGATHFAVNFCFLVALEGHAIPLTEPMLTYLKDHELVDPQNTQEEIETFLERHISASQGWEFYELLRQSAETGSKKPAPAKDAAKNKSAGKKKDGKQ
jgi:endonuclease III